MLDWLGGLPLPLLYTIIAIAAFLENIFPPLPADTAIALGAFIAARAQGTAIGIWTATMLGNLGGALLMFSLGKHLGTDWIHKKFPFLGTAESSRKLVDQYNKFGLLAICVSRFIPGVRAIVPPLAGAMGIRVVPALVVMSIASGLWYAFITFLAFNFGQNADSFLERIADSQLGFTLIAVGILAVVAVFLIIRRKRG